MNKIPFRTGPIHIPSDRNIAGGAVTGNVVALQAGLQHAVGAGRDVDEAFEQLLALVGVVWGCCRGCSARPDRHSGRTELVIPRKLNAIKWRLQGMGGEW